MDTNNGNVSLSISKELVNPIIQAKINEAVVSALGGQDELIRKSVDAIMNTKVNDQGKVSSYSSDNKYTMLEIIAKNKIEDALRKAVDSMLETNKDVLKDAMIKYLQTKKGVEAFVSSMLANAVNLKDAKMSVVFGEKEIPKPRY